MMKRILSIFLIASLAAGTICLNACTAKREEPSETQAAAELKTETDSHTLYFRDSNKSDKVAAIFLHSLPGESEEVEMVKCGEDPDAYTF